LKTFSGRKPSQHPAELGQFIDMLLRLGVRRYLEIGARHGDTFHAVMSALPKGSLGMAVDLPGGKWGQSNSQKALAAAAADIEAQGKTAVVVLADSHQAGTARTVRRHTPFDAVLIDGDHTLAGVTRDWELYGAMADVVAFHDIDGAGVTAKRGGHPVEVPLLWQKLRCGHGMAREIIAPGSKMGIGVLCK